MPSHDRPEPRRYAAVSVLADYDPGPLTGAPGGRGAAAWLLRSPSATVAAMASIPAGAGATVILAAIAPPQAWLLSSRLLMIIGGGCIAWLDWTTLRGAGELPPRSARMYALVRTLGVVAGAAALAFVVATGIGPWEPGP